MEPRDSTLGKSSCFQPKDFLTLGSSTVELPGSVADLLGSWNNKIDGAQRALPKALPFGGALGLNLKRGAEMEGDWGFLCYRSIQMVELFSAGVASKAGALLQACSEAEH
ncbi:hypothetical protein PPACK8108_LOCUS18395 [Phakopsora pachyrhizi]|uniref:Uncharacterized protein n=1 Tax=Phakopsora pachyrhizi TaxID=170000 RepID=A0AAV0BDB6_PHAPC|nr:hypothetical protein PPACK8108_LOCUS18395 [Phakopsora pachyrhizi]